MLNVVQSGGIWIDATNIVLGITVLFCIIIIGILCSRDIRRLRKFRKQANILYDTATLNLSSKGISLSSDRQHANGETPRDAESHIFVTEQGFIVGESQEKTD